MYVSFVSKTLCHKLHDNKGFQERRIQPLDQNLSFKQRCRNYACPSNFSFRKQNFDTGQTYGNKGEREEWITVSNNENIFHPGYYSFLWYWQVKRQTVKSLQGSIQESILPLWLWKTREVTAYHAVPTK
jgi:hypothetical protein